MKKKDKKKNLKIKNSSKEFPSGFDAFGYTVPIHRLTAGYHTVKEMIPGISKENAYTIVAKVAQHIKKDRPFEIIGNPTKEHALIDWLNRGKNKNQEIAEYELGMIDLTGRYRLLSVMLVG